jgi:hypothetical protein
VNKRSKLYHINLEINKLLINPFLYCFAISPAAKAAVDSINLVLSISKSPSLYRMFTTDNGLE